VFIGATTPIAGDTKLARRQVEHVPGVMIHANGELDPDVFTSSRSRD
jgi:CHASE2 domain-containing sensor protein